jgi:hypothetical protein
VDGITDEYPYAGAWAPHAVRAALDTVRGRLDEATRRLQELQAAAPAVLEDREPTALVTPCELWSNRPDLAFERLSRSLEDEVGSFDQISTGECQVLAVRAAADLADAGAETRRDLRLQVDRLLGGRREAGAARTRPRCRARPNTPTGQPEQPTSHGWPPDRGPTSGPQPSRMGHDRPPVRILVRAVARRPGCTGHRSGRAGQPVAATGRQGRARPPPARGGHPRDSTNHGGHSRATGVNRGHGDTPCRVAGAAVHDRSWIGLRLHRAGRQICDWMPARS